MIKVEKINKKFIILFFIILRIIKQHANPPSESVVFCWAELAFCLFLLFIVSWLSF